MGSGFVTQEEKKIKGFAGKQYKVPIYIQFIPGYVSEVVHSEKSLRYGGPNTINSIIGIPHIKNADYITRGTSGEKYRYFPLLRSNNDIPSKGDPVLLCTMMGTNYYLGPLSTEHNNPTWNDDPNYKPEITSIFLDKDVPISKRGEKGESLNFNKALRWSRLEKQKNDSLDYGPAINETTGDLILEGRHGNSIRIGSRNIFPYLFISNKRSYKNQRESLGDGTLITITSRGSLNQHFGTPYNEPVKIGPRDASGAPAILKEGFILASDEFFTEEDTPKRFMGTMVSSVNNNQDPNELIYNYGSESTGVGGNTISQGVTANQVLVSSDRITLNTNVDDIYLSSKKDIHIGTRRHLTVSTNENFIIDSEKTFLGNPVDTARQEAREMDNMVLGQQLKDVLNKILNLIPKIKIVTQLGAQTPMPVINEDITKISQDIEKITSNKHFIEPNN